MKTVSENARDQQPVPTDTPELAVLIKRIDSALASSDGHQLREAIDQGFMDDVIPKNVDLHRWALMTLDQDRTSRIVGVLASWPCPYCDHGLLCCEQCEGRSRFEDGTLCERCLAFGVARCEFCVGSGWFTYSAVPRGFWAPVLLERCQRAFGEIDMLFRRALPIVSVSSATNCRKELAKNVLVLDRWLGVLDNALSAGHDSSIFPEAFRPAVEQVLHRSIRIADQVRDRLRRCFRLLAEAAALEIGKGASAAGRDLAKSRTIFYKSLAKRGSFSDTALRHILLDESRKVR
jgi:hypothetical protein